MHLTEFERRLLPRLPEIARHFGTPFHIYDEIGIRNTLQGLLGAFSSRDIPFKEFYAVKALPNFEILKIIQSEGCGFDCSSITELRMVREIGAQPEDIMFTSNDTSEEEFREALAHGGCILNLDGIEYIEKVQALGPFPELICFRLNPGYKKTGNEVNSIIGNPVESKYGVPIENIVEAYRLAQKAGAKRFGLHTMVCSNDLDYTHMVATYKLLLEVVADIEKELGIKIEFINVGGGIGIPYRPNDIEFNIAALASECRQLGEEFRQTHGYVPKLYMESGRYVTGPHGVLVNRVINTFTKYQHFTGVEVAMPALMRVAIYSTAYHHCFPVNADGTMLEVGSRPIIITNVVGPICENCDRLANKIEMPEPHEGDFMITRNTGAHAIAMAFNYNGRERPQELLFRMDGSIIRISSAETYDDLVRRQRNFCGPENILVPPEFP